jgi:hypothetical protein
MHSKSLLVATIVGLLGVLVGNGQAY